MKKIFLVIVFIFISFSQMQAHPSYGIVVDKYRNIYFADLSHNGDGTVWKLSKEGKLTALFKNFHCHNLMLDKDENLVVEVEVQIGEIYKNFTMRYCDNGKIDTLANFSGYRTKSGYIYSYESKGYVWKTNTEGQKSKLSEHKLNWVQSIYADDEENVYLPDKGVDNGVLLKIDKKGNSKIIATNLIAKVDRPRDLHMDCILGVTKGCDGYIYVAETAGQRILKIINNKRTEVFYKSNGDWFPTGIDFFSGEAYIMEYKTKGRDKGPRIVKVDEFGKKTVIFDYNEYSKN